jgi:hypothetical protein
MLSYEDSILSVFEALSAFSDCHDVLANKKTKRYNGKVDIEGFDEKVNWSSILYIEPRLIHGETYRGFRLGTDIWKWASIGTDVEFDKSKRTADTVKSSLEDVCRAQRGLRIFLDDERDMLEAIITSLSGSDTPTDSIGREIPIPVYSHDMRLIYQPSRSVGDVIRFKYYKGIGDSRKDMFTASSLIITLDKLKPIMDFQIERLTEALGSLE